MNILILICLKKDIKNIFECSEADVIIEMF